MWNSTDSKAILDYLTPQGFCSRYGCGSPGLRGQPYDAFAAYGLSWAFDCIENQSIDDHRYTDFTGIDGLADYLRSILDQATAKLSGRDALIFAAGMYQAAAPNRPRRANWGPKTHAACCHAMAELIMRETELIDEDSHPWAYAY